MSEVIRFDHLKKPNSRLFDALDAIDRAAERSAALPRTPGQLTARDVDSAERSTPGIGALLKSAVENASARQMARSLETIASAATPPTPRREPVAVSGGEIMDVLSDAAKAHPVIAGDQMLESFVSRNRHALSPAQAVVLANSARFQEAPGRILTDFAESNYGGLTASEVLQLAEAAKWADWRDRILWGFAASQQHRLSYADLERLAGAAFGPGARDAILSLRP